MAPKNRPDGISLRSPINPFKFVDEDEEELAVCGAVEPCSEKGSSSDPSSDSPDPSSHSPDPSSHSPDPSSDSPDPSSHSSDPSSESSDPSSDELIVIDPAFGDISSFGAALLRSAEPIDTIPSLGSTPKQYPDRLTPKQVGHPTTSIAGSHPTSILSGRSFQQTLPPTSARRFTFNPAVPAHKRGGSSTGETTPSPGAVSPASPKTPDVNTERTAGTPPIAPEPQVVSRTARTEETVTRGYPVFMEDTDIGSSARHVRRGGDGGSRAGSRIPAENRFSPSLAGSRVPTVNRVPASLAGSRIPSGNIVPASLEEAVLSALEGGKSIAVFQKERIARAKQFFTDVFNGKILKEQYHQLSQQELFAEYQHHLDAYREYRRGEYSKKFGINVAPMGEFERGFSNTKRLIESFFNYQLTSQAVQKLLADYTLMCSDNADTTERAEAETNFYSVVNSDRFDSLVKIFPAVYNSSLFNNAGYKVLRVQYDRLENLFDSGTFKSVGCRLLNEAEASIIGLGVQISKTPDFPDKYVEIVSNLKGVIDELKQYGWRFTPDNIKILRAGYKLFKEPYFSEPDWLPYRSEIGDKIDEAVRKWRRPSLMETEVLSDKAVDYLNVVREIIRNSYALRGNIKNSDLETLNFVYAYFKRLLKLHAKLFTTEQISFMSDVSQGLEHLLRDGLRFDSGCDEKDKTALLEIIRGARGSFVADHLDKEFEAQKWSAFTLNKAPTQMLGKINVGEGFSKEDFSPISGVHGVLPDNADETVTFVKDVLAVSKRPEFSSFIDEQLNFLRSIHELEKNEFEEDFEALLNNLNVLKLPPFGLLPQYFNTNLERMVLILTAKKIDEYRSSGTNTSYQEIYAYAQSLKSRLKSKLFHFVLINECIPTFLNPSETETENNQDVISSMYSFAYVVSNEYFAQNTNSGLDREVRDIEEFKEKIMYYTRLGTLLGVAKNVYSMKFNVDFQSLKEDAKKFLNEIVNLAFLQSSPTPHHLESNYIGMAKKTVNFCFDVLGDDRSGCFAKDLYMGALDVFSPPEYKGDMKNFKLFSQLGVDIYKESAIFEVNPEGFNFAEKLSSPLFIKKIRTFLTALIHFSNDGYKPEFVLSEPERNIMESAVKFCVRVSSSSSLIEGSVYSREIYFEAISKFVKKADFDF